MAVEEEIDDAEPILTTLLLRAEDARVPLRSLLGRAERMRPDEGRADMIDLVLVRRIFCHAHTHSLSLSLSPISLPLPLFSLVLY